MKRIYFDHAAATPLDRRVYDVMEEYTLREYGNASSLHSFGMKARAGIQNSRETIARIINAQGPEIYFTSSGTESDNLALKGCAYAYRDKGNHIITSSFEHPAVLNSCKFLESEGFLVTYLGVDEYGMVSSSDVEKHITDNTILVSIMHANNEIGTIQDIEEVGRITSENDVLFHTDAVQTFVKIPIDVKKCRIDLLTISAHKIYGPKGCGALYIKKGTDIHPLIHGGSHERNRRAGTENVAGIVGFGKAAEIRVGEMEKEYNFLSELEQYFREKLLNTIDGIYFNGNADKKLPGFINVSISGTEGESLLLSLDLAGIAVSSGSACASGSAEISHVLRAMGLPSERAGGSIRITLGKQNTTEDIDYALEVLPKAVKRLRDLMADY